mgnify:CR=1 FL=1
MNHNRGKFFVFEGTDGSGKRTQLELLASYLENLGFEAEMTDFPQYYTSFFGGLVGRYLSGEFGDTGEVSPYLASLAYAGDRFEAKDKIERALTQGKFVISNRYIGSNMAHQAAKLIEGERETFWDWLLKLEFGIFKIPKPDLTIFLYVPVETGQGLVDRKGSRGYLGGKKRDIHERNLDYLREASRVYQKLSERFDDWERVDCVNRNGDLLSKEVIHQKITALLRDKVLV